MVPEVLAHLLYSSTLLFRCKNISLKHSRTLSTKHFSFTNVEMNILQLTIYLGKMNLFQSQKRYIFLSNIVSQS
jgi:hypothetical protein